MGKGRLSIPMKAARLWPLVLFLALEAGCGDDGQSPIRFRHSPRSDEGEGPFVATVPEPAADAHFQAPVQTGSAPVLLAGRLPAGFAARPFFRFATLPETTAVDPDSIVSATLTVIARDRYGADPTTLSLFTAASDWTADSLAYVEDAGGTFIGDLSPGDIATADTTRMTAVVPPAVVSAWLRRRDSNFGMYLESPASDAMTRLFSKEANPGERTPSLTIRYRAAGDIDTVVVVAGEDATALRVPPADPSGQEPSLEIANGQGLRALVRFDTDSLRARVPEGGTLNRARLVLSVVGTSRVLGAVPMAAFAVTSEWEEATASSSVTVASSASATASYAVGGDSIAFEIAGLVQQWIDGDLENRGVLIRSTVEPNDLATIAVGSRESATATLRPRLDLVYTLPPGPRP